MIITVTEKRECCQMKDLKPVHGCRLIGRDPELKFCIHCGARHKYEGFIDAAGSRDWEYRKVEEKL